MTNIQITFGGENARMECGSDSEIVTVFKFQPSGRVGLMEAVSSLTCRQSKDGNITALTHLEPIIKGDTKYVTSGKTKIQASPSKSGGAVESTRRYTKHRQKEPVGVSDGLTLELIANQTDQEDHNSDIVSLGPDVVNSTKESFMQAMQLAEKVKNKANTPPVRKSRRSTKGTSTKKTVDGNRKKDVKKKSATVEVEEEETNRVRNEEMEIEEKIRVCDNKDNVEKKENEPCDKVENVQQQLHMNKTTRRQVRLHRRVSSLMKPHGCPDCSERFERYAQLEQHRKIHTGEFQYACDTCYLGFKTKNGFLEHMTIHTGSKPYSCSICKKDFRQQTGLQQHIQTHSDVKKYKCTSCDAAFRTNTHLKVHMRMHTGEKPYACMFCPDKFYRDLSSMRRHNLRHHGHPHSQYKVVTSKKKKVPTATLR